jgi:hypothetical protein
LPPSHYRVWITKLGTSDLKLGIPKENILTLYFLPQNIGDEFDVLFNCENDVISDFKNNSYPAIIVKTQALKKMGRTFPDYHIQLLTNVAFFIKKICNFL